jgi:hypothetical protein
LLKDKPLFVLLVLLVVWLALASPRLFEQWGQTSALRARLAGKPPQERALFFDSPLLRVSGEVAASTPEDACVTVLAYAGPDALKYYRARFRYELYPRRVDVVAASSANLDRCAYLAVFRDSEANLRQSPFAGEWNAEQLRERLAGFTRVGGATANIYRTR